MDYKKKYKTLVNAVMELQKANPSDEGIQNWVNENVPELAGNKDDRIKKYLISFIKLESGVNLPLDDAGKILSWPEKQGEKEPAGFYYVNSEGEKFYSETFKYGDVTLHVEKQGERKSTDNLT